ncbi:3,4-dihydroxy-2-butanone 4-phosphate synthase [Pseudoscourfieldia marina]
MMFTSTPAASSSCCMRRQRCSGVALRRSCRSNHTFKNHGGSSSSSSFPPCGKSLGASHVTRVAGSHSSSWKNVHSATISSSQSSSQIQEEGSSKAQETEQTTTTHNNAIVDKAIEDIRAGKLVAILDAVDREGETDLVIAAEHLTPKALRLLRTSAGGELYMPVGHEVTSAFNLPRAGAALAASRTIPQAMAKSVGDMCQGSCSVGISLDHRSTKTGAPDDERSFTCRRLAALYEEVVDEGLSPAEAAERLSDEYHVPGHIFLCHEDPNGLNVRRGHSELGPYLVRAAGLTPVAVACVMLNNAPDSDDYGALRPELARRWCEDHGVVFLEGADLVQHHATNVELNKSR